MVSSKFVPKNYRIVLIRHGESEWNQKNLFSGWYDALLSSKGQKEAIEAGKILKEQKFVFDKAHTSLLSRAQSTLHTILIELKQHRYVTVRKSWRLNERHYGALTGLNKAETVEKYGEEQVQIWRRSYDVAPPPMEKDHPFYKSILEKIQSGGDIMPNDIPKSESLKMTTERLLPYWQGHIVPDIKTGKKIIISAHGNALRAIIKIVENMSDSDIVKVEIPTGMPFVYDLDDSLKPLNGGSFRYLGDTKTIKKAVEKVSTIISTIKGKK